MLVAGALISAFGMLLGILWAKHSRHPAAIVPA